MKVLDACGKDPPEPITSSSNVIYLRYEAEYSRQGVKFLIDWLEVTPNATNSEKEGEST